MVLFSSLDEDILSASFHFTTTDGTRYPSWMHDMARPESSSSTCTRSDCSSSRSRSPVGQWLFLLRDQTEVESLSALQAKSVATNEESLEALSVRNAQVAIRKTRRESVDIIHIIDCLLDLLPLTLDDLHDFQVNLYDLTFRTQSLLEHCRRRGCDTTRGMKGRKMSNDVAVYGLQLSKLVEDFANKKNVQNSNLDITLRKMRGKLLEVIDTSITLDCSIIVNALRFPWGSICSKWSLLALWQLTQHDASICGFFIRNPHLIKRLIKLSSSSPVNPQLKASALRVLTHLSSNGESTGQIFADHECGSSLISLLSFERNELVLKEAVGLIVQVTMPLIDCNRKNKASAPHVTSSISQVIPVPLLVKSLTNLARVSYSKELFLLITASLANISFLETESFVSNETCNVLMTAVKQRSHFVSDVPLKDQIITILANLASHHPMELVSSGGLVFLLSALELRPISVEMPPPSTSTSPVDEDSIDSLAIERIQQKIAAALARIATDRSCASLLLRLNGVRRLVDLCRDPRERNFSDTVLLASLAALRRIGNSIGHEPLKQLDAMDLVNGSLKEAFFICSSQNESYV